MKSTISLDILEMAEMSFLMKMVSVCSLFPNISNNDLFDQPKFANKQ